MFPGCSQLRLIVSSVEELARECGRFHDFPFELETQVYDAVRRTWTGHFLRGTDDRSRIITTRRALIVTVTEFPVIETRVTIRNVLDTEIQDRAQIGSYTFRQVHRTSAGCRFEFHQDCDIYIDVDGPFEAEVCDLRELPDTSGRITSLGFMDFGIQVGAVTPRDGFL